MNRTRPLTASSVRTTRISADPLHTALDCAEEAPELTETLYTSTDALLGIRSPWERLAGDSSAMVQSTPEWTLGWWKEFGGGPNRRLNVLGWWEGDRMVGLAPLYMGRSRLAGVGLQRRLRLIGSGGSTSEVFGFSDDYGISDFLDILTAPGYEKTIAERMAARMKENPENVDYLQLLHVREEQFASSVLFPELARAGLSPRRHVSDQCPYIDLEPHAAVDAFIASRTSRSARRRLRQSQSGHAGGLPFEVERIRGQRRLDEAFGHLVELHQQRWNRVGFPGIFDDPRFSRFILPLLHEMERMGRFMGFLARAPDGHVLAVRFGFAYQGRIYDFLTGFDDAHPMSRNRPGYALLMAMIEQAMEQGMHRIELLRGTEEYKFDFTDTCRRNVYIEVFTPSGRKRAALNRVVNGVSCMARAASRERRLVRVHLSNARFAGLFSYGEQRVQSLRTRMQGDAKCASTELPPVLTLSEIGLVHSLGRAGLPVVAGTFFDGNVALRSTYVSDQVRFAPYDSPRFVEQLLELASTRSTPMVLMSDDDRAILAVSRNRSLLAPHYRFELPDARLVDRVYNKSAFIGLCREKGLPAPAGMAVDSPDDLERAVREMPFPLVVKPPYKEYWWRSDFEREVGPYKKALLAETPAELRALYSNVARIHPSVLLQEYVPGGDDAHYSVNLLMGADGEPASLFMARKHRVHPVGAGVGCLIQILPAHDELEAATRDVCSRLELRGLVNIQFKQHAQTGEFKLIEIQFRNSTWGYIGTAAGRNLPALYYAGLTGALEPPMAGTLPPLKLIDPGKDVKASLRHIRDGRLTPADWIRSYSGPKIYHGMLAADPVPALLSVWNLAARRAKGGAYGQAAAPGSAPASAPAPAGMAASARSREAASRRNGSPS